MFRRLFPQAPPAIEIELTEKLLSSGAGIRLVGIIAGATGAQAALNGDPVPAALLLMISLVALIRFVGLRSMRQMQAKRSPNLATARRWHLRYGLGSCLTSLLLGATNVVVLSYQDPTLTLLVVCGLCCYVFSLILRTAVRPLVCLSSIAIALIPTSVGLLVFLNYGTRLSTGYALMAVATIAVVIGMASVQLTAHLYATTLGQLTAQHDLILFARRDPLTGLSNRLALREQFEAPFVDPSFSIALFYVDLDDFKLVNDLHGHQVGDALLVQAAIRLDSCVGSGGNAFRIGGDEFVVLLSKVRHRDDATEMARCLIASLSKTYELGSATVQVGASIGVALVDSENIDLDDLMASADAALYDAKQFGQSTYRFAESGNST